MPALVTGSSPSPPTPRKLLRWTSFPAQLFINCKLGGGLTGPIANRTFTHQHSRRHFWLPNYVERCRSHFGQPGKIFNLEQHGHCPLPACDGRSCCTARRKATQWLL